MDLDVLFERKPTTLVKAVREGDIKAVENLLRAGIAHPNSCDHRGWTALHEAAAHNRLDMVKILLEDERTNPDADAHDGDFALDVAVSHNASVELIDSLARCTKKFNQEEYACRLLDEATRNGSVEIVKYLLTNTKIDIQGKKQYSPCSPVFIAIARNDERILKLLLDACTDINDIYDERYYKKTILFAIDVGCNRNTIEQLVQKGAKLDFNITALMYAISNNRTEIALELLKHDVNVDYEFCGSTALNSAVLMRQGEVVRELIPRISLGALESLCERPGFIGLICCSLSKYDDEILSMLLDSNFSEPILEAPVGIRFRQTRIRLCYEYSGPLSFFFKEKMDLYGDQTVSITQLLLSKGLSIEPRKLSYMPPLVGALLSKSKTSNDPPSILKSILKILLDSGVNVDHKTSILPDALLAAISEESHEILTMLLPYSRFTPCDIVKAGILHDIGFVYNFVLERMISVDDYFELRNCWRCNDEVRKRCEEVFSRYTFKVSPLSVIARRKVRQCFPITKTTSEFLSCVNKLVIPETLKNYLRFL